MLSIVLKIDTVIINDADGVTKAKLIPTAKVLLNCTNKDVTCMGRNGEVIVNMLDHQENSVVDLDPKSPQKKESNL